MKTMHSMIILFLWIVSTINPQPISNIQRAVDIVAINNISPNDPNSYIWSESSNIKQGVHISVVPHAVSKIYLQKNNSMINFHTWNYGYMLQLKVKYDNENWQTIFSDEARETSGFSPSLSEVILQLPFTNLKFIIPEPMFN